MITFQNTTDLQNSAEITYSNMQPYYLHYEIDWDLDTIKQKILTLKNIDILFGRVLIGAIRLEQDSEIFYLRDLQINKSHQNRGIGAAAFEEVKRLAISTGANIIRLRVFKISPAYHLYQRLGFIVEKEEDKFYCMQFNL
ncbi:GNAT family N-acetyltransferase [Vibrio hepatarius]|uniref:GNAT family N-acetyltransferase n=1 Tax=Vibrio hepatarius TaxID=171383 RepID=UPI001C088D87|nr:GNAT family N-acetyltransferase [Vibrio hepatarius]